MNEIMSINNCLDGLINNNPCMLRATPAQQATALMELAEQDGERLGPEERRLVLEYAKAVRDSGRTMDLVYELAESAYELQCGDIDPAMEAYIQREIAAAYAAEDERMEALAAAM